MIQEYQLRVLPEVAANEQRIKEYLIQEKGVSARDITATRILKRSIDARQRTIFVNLTVRAYLNELPKEKEYQETVYNDVSDKPQVIVVGAGPGGLFAALRLIELGLRPVIVERGKNVRDRKKDLALIGREQTVNPESNYSFGEGGAGAYSDGKLYTRSKKRGNVDKILNVFCQHGASSSILVDAHPHIGTDKLPRVIENMRNTIIGCGGEVHFETRMDALIIENDEVKGIETDTGRTLRTRCIPLAGSQRSGNRSQRHRRRSTSGTSRFPDRPDTIPQPQRTRQIPARRRVQLRYPSGRKRRVQLLHVSRRLCSSGSQRSPANRSQRNEPQQPGVPVEQFGNGSGAASGRLGE